MIRRLEEDIIFGRFAPGSRLVEDTLMARYGASRHFVRQGLFQLERQGIVLREKNIGATVRFYSSEEVRQIYEVREMLTRQAALMIALPAPTKLIEQLTELQRQYCARADAQDLRGIHEANDAFHVALFSACGNPYLVRSLQDYMNLTLPMRAKNLADKRRPGAVAPPARIHDRTAAAAATAGRWRSSASITCNTASRIISAGSLARSRHFQSTIRLMSPSNSMPQNEPPW